MFVFPLLMSAFQKIQFRKQTYNFRWRSAVAESLWYQTPYSAYSERVPLDLDRVPRLCLSVFLFRFSDHPYNYPLAFILMFPFPNLLLIRVLVYVLDPSFTTFPFVSYPTSIRRNLVMRLFTIRHPLISLSAKSQLGRVGIWCCC